MNINSSELLNVNVKLFLSYPREDEDQWNE